MAKLKFLQKSSLIIAVAVLATACSSSPPMPSGTSSRSGAKAAFYATKLVGARYHYGGNSPSRGFDCSGLVQYSYKLAGVRIPRNTRYQFEHSRYIRRSELRKGDLLFFNQEGKRFSHVGIYIGNNKFVHAPSSGKRVRVSRISNPYWSRHLASTRRLY
ncbi:MAG: C40 family peptidase [Acidiferrobacterales bacterium]